MSGANECANVRVLQRLDLAQSLPDASGASRGRMRAIDVVVATPTCPGVRVLSTWGAQAGGSAHVAGRAASVQAGSRATQTDDGGRLWCRRDRGAQASLPVTMLVRVLRYAHKHSQNAHKLHFFTLIVIVCALVMRQSNHSI